MRTLIVIPARYASSRFPGKPLAPLRGAGGAPKPLIERTWEAGIAAAAAIGDAARVVVATDDARIRDVAASAGADVVMTPVDCENGTERCAAVVEAIDEAPDVVINLQGDSPVTPSSFVTALADVMADQHIETATVALRCDGGLLARFRDERRRGLVGGTTAVTDVKGDALYFSKEVVPFTDVVYEDAAPTPVLHHVGLYAYRPSALRAYAAASPTALERLEGLEQLRFLAHGVRMRVVETAAPGRDFCELNNPEDTPRIEAILAALGVE